jgi:DNA polymerase-3 subunit gamma/tau
MAPELVILPADQVEAIARRAGELGPAVLVRAIELLGTTMVEMRLSPDPRILAEVALLQLTNDEAGTDVDALLARIERLENTVKQLREERPQGLAAVQSPKDPTTGRAVLGGAARGNPAPTRSRPVRAEAQAATATAVAPVPTSGPVTVPEAWEHTVKAQVKPLVRALYSAGSFIGNSGGTWQFSVPNEAHGAKCREHSAAVEAALTLVVGEPVTVEFVVAGRAPDDEPATVTPGTRSQPAGDPTVDEIDLSELTDAPPEAVRTPIDRLAEAFPGSEFVTEA